MTSKPPPGSGSPSGSPAPTGLDPVAHEILEILQQDARVTTADLASMIGRSVSVTQGIIARLEDAGVIRRYKTIVDWERAGEERVTAFVDVKVSPARNVGFDDVAERIYRFPEVLSVYLVSGDHDLRVMVEGANIKDVAFFISDRLASLDRVLGTSTHFLLKRYKEEGVAFVDGETDNRLEVTP